MIKFGKFRYLNLFPSLYVIIFCFIIESHVKTKISAYYSVSNYLKTSYLLSFPITVPYLTNKEKSQSNNSFYFFLDRNMYPTNPSEMLPLCRNYLPDGEACEFLRS
jgi:hypothetical protein